MSASQIKRRIFALKELAAFPAFAVPLGVSPDIALDLKAVLDALAGEPELRARAKRLLQGSSDSSAALSQLLLQEAALRVFPLEQSGKLDRSAFWKQSFAAAQIAAELAVASGEVAPREAYLAALLHDAGKLALERLLPEAFARATELARAQGLFVLEAERREMGIDHTLAGKWLAEAWGLPTRIADAIWLHHHPTALVAAGPYPAALVHVVALADLLARHKLHAAPSSRFSAGIEDRRKRLNLSTEFLQQLEAAPPPWELPEEAAPQLEPTRNPADLERELRRVQALYALFRGVARSQTLEDALDHFVEALRDTYRFPSGICLLEQPGSGALSGKSWKSLDSGIDELCIDAAAEKGKPTAAVRLLRQVLGSAQAPTGLIDSGLLVLPLRAAEGLRGQLLVDASSLPLTERHLVLEDLMHFLGVAVEALVQCRRQEVLAERQEALTTAQWRQELQHHQNLRHERLASVNKLAAGAAHEINNPLAIISGQAQILMGRARTPEDLRALEQIVQQTRRAGKIILDLAHFAKPPTPRLETGALSEVLQRVIDGAREHLAQAGIEVLLDFGKLQPKVLIDPRQMEQVFQHLVTNAEQAMPGGGTLTVRARASRDRKSVVVQVSDTGIGVAPEHINQVFEPFVSLWEGRQGIGMGLAVCHGIIEAHRGAIALHSHPGEGTTCTITLPAASEAAEPAQASAERPQEPRQYTLHLAIGGRNQISGLASANGLYVINSSKVQLTNVSSRYNTGVGIAIQNTNNSIFTNCMAQNNTTANWWWATLTNVLIPGLLGTSSNL